MARQLDDRRAARLGAAVTLGLATAGLADPPNDLCADAEAITFPVGGGTYETTGTLAGAHSDAPSDGTLPIADPNGARPDVYYRLTIPPGPPKRVVVTLRGLAGSNILNPSLDLHLTNAADPCGGPFQSKAGESYGVNEAQGLPWFVHGEMLDLTAGCLAGGTYLITVGAASVASDDGGDFALDVACLPCTAGNATIFPAGLSGEELRSFAPGQPLYLGGSFSDGRTRSYYILPSDQIQPGMELPGLFGRSSWVKPNPDGQPGGTDSKTQSPGESFFFYNSAGPALAWPQTEPGEYTIVLDRDGDRTFDPIVDATDGGGFVVVIDCVGDTNDDAFVDADDLVNIILDWDGDGVANGGDVTGDDIVDVDDLTTVILHWGTCEPPADTTQPLIVCPPDIVIGPDVVPVPALTGMATAYDDADPMPEITYHDVDGNGVITRVWQATDESGNVGQCIQLIYYG